MNCFMPESARERRKDIECRALKLILHGSVLAGFDILGAGTVSWEGGGVDHFIEPIQI